MRYVQYFQRGVITGDLIETCGDRGVVILDARNNLTTSHSDAVKFNGFRRPNYAAYQLREGETFFRSHPVSKVISLPD